MGKKRILVVDDESMITSTFKEFLERTGKYEVREENSGVRALDAVKEFQPDLVLLDILLPDLDGASIAAALKQDDNLKDIPIIFLTGLVTKQDVGTQGREIGGHPFLAKPLKPEEVLWVVEGNLG